MFVPNNFNGKSALKLSSVDGVMQEYRGKLKGQEVKSFTRAALRGHRRCARR